MVVRKRSVTIHGHATSFSIEDEFWDACRVLARQSGMSLAAYVAHVDETRPRDANLSSALRVNILAAAIKGYLTADGGDHSA